MKNFDDDRAARAAADRSFQIGGETFVMKVGVRPEVLADYEKLGSNDSAVESLKVIDTLILDFVETDGDAVDRYHAIRARDDDPITLRDMTDLVDWLVKEQTGRTPTLPPSPSAPGRKRTATT